MSAVHKAPGVALDEHCVRRWLADLRRPERLDDPVMRSLLRAYGRDVTGRSVIVGRQAARVLLDTIESLRPREGDVRADQLPYRVLKLCFVDGAKAFQAAPRLGVSERQLSRERSRAIGLLTAALATPLARVRPLSAVPTTTGIVPRPDLWRRFGDMVEQPGRAHVYGRPGAGKTSLVASYVRASGQPTFWYRVVPRINDDLCAILVDLAENLAPDDPKLARYLDEALPQANVAVATRIALNTLRGTSRIIVLDDFDCLASDARTVAFLDELVDRLPQVWVVTIGREISGAPLAGRRVNVPSLDLQETAAVLTARQVQMDDNRIQMIYGWTGGNATLVDVVAGFLADPTRAAIERVSARSGPLVLESLRALTAWSADAPEWDTSKDGRPRRTSDARREPFPRLSTLGA